MVYKMTASMTLLLTLAGPMCCTAYEQKTMNQLHTVCSNDTQTISTWNRTLDRWETPVTPH